MENKKMIFLKDSEVGEMIGMKVNTLRTWRQRGIGPKYIKGEGQKGAIRYEIEDVLAWIKEARERGNLQRSK